MAGSEVVVGKKYDEGKCRLELVPPSLIKAVGWVLTDGAAKYGDRNWENGLAWSRPYAAILRHLLAWQDRETNDSESGRNHLWHAACELAFLIEYEKTHPELDDRPSNKTT